MTYVTDIGNSYWHAFGPEKDPGKRDKNKSCGHLPKLFQVGEEAILSHHIRKVFAVAIEEQKGQEATGVKESPYDEIPTGAMPKTANQKNDKCISYRLKFAIF